MRPWRTIALLSLLMPSASSFGQSSSYRDTDWKQTCEQATATPIEQPNLQRPVSASNPANCNEQDLYYGAKGKPDYPGALQCGWYERTHPKPNQANMLYGPGVLTMLYANGQAVPRNYDLAIRFACEQEWASPAEMEMRIGHLEAMRDGRADRTRFDLCDDITSGLSMGACTSIQTGRADAKRDEEINAIAVRLPEAAKASFERLQKAEAEFEDTRSGDEIDLSGTARVMFELEEQKKLRDQFLINLQRFGSEDVPRASEKDLAALDRALNSTYQDIERAPADMWKYGTVKPEGIRETEQKWVALAEAWVEFAKEAYPNLNANTVRAQIIRLRLHQLRSLGPKE
jgi:hypothetical protein